jgi:hypothetical protein
MEGKGRIFIFIFGLESGWERGAKACDLKVDSPYLWMDNLIYGHSKYGCKKWRIFIIINF